MTDGHHHDDVRSGDDHGGDHEHHDHGHEHHPHDHGAAHRRGLIDGVRSLLAPHSHDVADSIDSALTSSRDGMRALTVSLVVLAVTAGVQGLIAAVSGSVGLLADTIHNAADALTALPLGVAFLLGRRRATRRYTYGYGRAEDLAGIAIVAVIAFSAAVAGWEAVDRLARPHRVGQLGLVMAGGAIGFVGNELAARYRIGTGRRIGSAALVADGLHARTDGLTSLAVVIGAVGVLAGWRPADALVGLLISVAILRVLVSAARDIYRRLMDSVEPQLVGRIEALAMTVDGVEEVTSVRVRWVGHDLHAAIRLTVDPGLTVTAAHDISEAVHHELLHRIPRLKEAIIHCDPRAGHGQDPHARTDHHEHW